MDLFEESLLKLGREIPNAARAPLIALLKTFKGDDSSRSI